MFSTRRRQRRMLNILAFALLAFAIYLNFFYKEQDSTLRVNPADAEGTAALSK